MSESQFTKIDWVEGAGVYRVVAMDKVEEEMKRGFRPIGMFRDTVTYLSEQDVMEPDPRGVPRHYGTEWRRRTDERMCCLMVQDATLMVQDYDQRLAKEREKGYELQRQMADAQVALSRVEKERDRLKAVSEQLGQKSDQLTDQLREVEGQRQELEAAMAKVREAIGAKAWKEILG